VSGGVYHQGDQSLTITTIATGETKAGALSNELTILKPRTFGSGSFRVVPMDYRCLALERFLFKAAVLTDASLVTGDNATTNAEDYDAEHKVSFSTQFQVPFVRIPTERGTTRMTYAEQVSPLTAATSMATLDFANITTADSKLAYLLQAIEPSLVQSKSREFLSKTWIELNILPRFENSWSPGESETVKNSF
jgi:hypothetical protein